MLDFIITDSEAERLLLNRKAAVILGVAGVLSICTIVVRFTNFDFAAMSRSELERVSWLGALLAVGALGLWAGMWLFWLKCDASSRLARTIWFVLLLAGVGLGAQIAYYAIVYLPAVRKKLSNFGTATTGHSSKPASSQSDAGTAESNKRRKIFGPFGWALVIGWGIFVLLVTALFTFPKGVSHLIWPSANFSVFFGLWMLSLILGSAVYAVILLFRAGMRRTPTPPQLN